MVYKFNDSQVSQVHKFNDSQVHKFNDSQVHKFNDIKYLKKRLKDN